MKFKTIITLTILAILCGSLARSAQAAPAATPAVSITPVVLNFGNLKANSISPGQAVRVTNLGDSDLTLGPMIVSGEFAINNKCNNVTLAPSASCTFLVAFKPLSNGIKNGTVNIPSNATPATETVILYGTSYPTAQLLQHENFEPPSGLVFRAPIRWETSRLGVPLFAVWDCTVSLSDKCSARLSGSPRLMNVEQSIYQWGEISGPAGTQFYFGLSSRAQDVGGGGKYLVQLTLFNSFNKPVGIYELHFVPDTNDFQIKGEVTNPPTTGAFSYFVYRIVFQKAAGTAWFDNAVLIRLP